MRRAATALIMATAPFLMPSMAVAQSEDGTTASAPEPDEQRIVVRSTDPRVCRQIRRTGTRMRTGRVCRTIEQAQNEQDGRSQDDMLAEAADTLEVLGEKISTGDIGGMPSGGPGPY